MDIKIQQIKLIMLYKFANGKQGWKKLSGLGLQVTFNTYGFVAPKAYPPN